MLLLDLSRLLEDEIAARDPRAHEHDGQDRRSGDLRQPPVPRRAARREQPEATWRWALGMRERREPAGDGRPCALSCYAGWRVLAERRAQQLFRAGLGQRRGHVSRHVQEYLSLL